MKNKINELDLILKPSKIEGIGVFANRILKKDEKFYWEKKVRKISKSKAKKNKKLHSLCKRYCVETINGYLCPENFSAMSIFWFLNHSKKPNFTKGKTYYITNKIIKEGEELVTDYAKLDKNVSNAISNKNKLIK